MTKPNTSIVGRKWVNCPICGEPDMRSEPDGEDGHVIHCVNLNCGSNGGTMFDAAQLRLPSPSVMQFAQQIVDSEQLCERLWQEMMGKRDANAQWGQSKEYHAAYHAHNDAVNARYILLRDNQKAIAQLALALITARIPCPTIR